MKIGAVILGLIGSGIGFLLAMVEHGGIINRIAHIPYGPLDTQLSHITVAASVLGIIGVLFVYIKPKWGGAILLLASVIGIAGSYVLWEGPGSFLVIGGLLALFSTRNQTFSEIVDE